MLYVTYSDEYVTVSPEPWGHIGTVNRIGPVEPEFADTAVEATVRLLESLGRRVLTVEAATGELAGDRYHPTPDELADCPLVATGLDSTVH